MIGTPIIYDGNEMGGRVFVDIGSAHTTRSLLVAWPEVHHNDVKTPSFQQNIGFANTVCLRDNLGDVVSREISFLRHNTTCEELQNAQN